MIVPSPTVNLLTERAISAALSLGETVVAVAVAGDEEECEQIKRDWDEWECGVPIEVLLDPHRSLVRTVLRYVESIATDDATVTVLIPEIIPQAPPRDPPQPARTPAGRDAAVADRRDRGDDALPSARLEESRPDGAFDMRPT